MGFHVTIREEDKQLLSHLRETPAEVFDRPYGGYLLFLIGGADAKALKWLRKHLVPLDSLTGSHVAYAIFAESVPLGLSAKHSEEKKSGHVADVPLREVFRIDEHLSAINKAVADGDHINAITYATDRVAREFGVLRNLPCLLVLDAFPTEDIEVIELRDSSLPALIDLLRNGIDRFYRTGGFNEFARTLDDFNELRSKLKRLQRDIVAARVAVSIHPRESDVRSDLHRRYETLRESLASGSHKQFNEQVASLRHLLRATGITLPERLEPVEAKPMVHRRQTIEAIDKYASKTWPLVHEDRKGLELLFRNYVSRLLSDISPTTEFGQSDLEQARNRLQTELDALIEAVMRAYGSPEDAAKALIDRHAAADRSSESRLDSLLRELDTVGSQASAVSSFLGRENMPSLQRSIRAAAQERQLALIRTKVADKAKAFAGDVLKPESLINLAKLAIGAG